MARNSVRAEDISIDYAVMETLEQRQRGAVRNGLERHWLVAVHQRTTPRPTHAATAFMAKPSCTKWTNCFIRSEDGRMIGAVGVQDLIVVDTADALLIASRDRAQDVKQIVAKLKRVNHDAYRLHRTVHRPWGTYTRARRRGSLQDEAHCGEAERAIVVADAPSP